MEKKVPIHVVIVISMLALLVVLWAAPVSGDVVYLKNGGRLEGKVTEAGTMIRVDFRGGSMTLHKRDVTRIEKRALPEEIFAGRLQKAASDAQACVRLAEWALGQQLEREYVQALRMALLVDPKHKRARALLRKYRLHRQRLPYNEKAEREMLAEMGEGFQILRTDHYRICYNCAEIFAEITGERLERLYAEFMVFFEDRNFEPAPLTDRLEVVLFGSPPEYRRYAGGLAPKMAQAEGFYSSKTGRSYFYDSISEDNSGYRQTYDRLCQEQQKVDEFRPKVEENRDDAVRYVVTENDGSQRKLDRREMLKELDRRERVLEQEFDRLRDYYRDKNIKVTIHEGTHQLAYTCGIHSRYFDNPKWLVEGLAMYFEAAGAGQWDGPGEMNRTRLKTFIEACRSGRVVGLEELISRDAVVEVDTAGAGASYAMAWALFYYLVNERHESLFDYVYELSLRLSGTAYKAEQRARDFEKHFGRLGRVERDWREYLDSMAR